MSKRAPLAVFSMAGVVALANRGNSKKQIDKHCAQIKEYKEIITKEPH